MEPNHMGERRSESRSSVDISVRVWGVDVRGDCFLQEAKVREISLNGGLLSQLETEVRSGDVIGVLYAGKKGRYRVIWVRHSGMNHKIQAAIHRFEGDECPWAKLLPERESAAAAGAPK